MKIFTIFKNLGKIKSKVSSILEGIKAVEEVLKGLESLLKSKDDVKIIKKALEIVVLINSKLSWVTDLFGGVTVGLSRPTDTNKYLDEVIARLKD